MKRAALALLVVPFIALWMVACDGEPPSAPEATPETTALFGKIPTNPTACYTAGMAASGASEEYGEAAKDLAKCDQAAKGPCDVEQEAHVTAWLEMSDLYESALAICGGEPPSENLPPEISSVEISPNPAYPDTPELTCQAVYSDPDGDDLSVSYKWLKDGSATEAAIDNVYPGPFLTGEYYTCEVTVSDGQAQDVAFGDLYIDEALCEPDETESRECPYGDPEIRICQGNGTWGPWSDCIEPNTPPEITGVTIEPANPTTATQSLECVLQGWTDADGDFVNFYFEWYGDGVPDTETSNVLSLGGVSAGQQFYCAIIADDGTDQTRVESQVVTILEAGGITDTDGDGMPDTLDSCPDGYSDWTYYPGTPEDLDEDGCHDSAEDLELVKYYGGDIRSDQVWIDGVTHRITSNLYIGDNSLEPIVTIEDGAVVEADVGVEIYVGYASTGGLQANGAANGILFTSPSSTPLPGDWDGIYFGQYNLPSSYLNGVTVEYGGGNGFGNVVCNSTSLTVSNSDVAASDNHGFYLMSASSLSISDSSIRDSDGYGIYLQGGSTATIINVDFSGNASGDISP